MSVANVVVAVLSDEDLDLLPALVDEFVSTHPSLRFREAYWSALREWLGQRLKDENTLALTAKVGGALAGFALAAVQDHGPLMAPERLGYVSFIVAPGSHGVPVSAARSGRACKSGSWHKAYGTLSSMPSWETNSPPPFGNVAASPSFWRGVGGTSRRDLNDRYENS